MPYTPDFKPDMSGRNLPRVLPFNKTALTMSPQELELPVHYFAIHALPFDPIVRANRTLLRWRFVCVHVPEDPTQKARAVNIEVYNRDIMNGRPISRVVAWSEPFFKQKTIIDNKNPQHFWWYRKTYTTGYGGTPYFGDIIDFLERVDNRYEKFVDARTLEGTYGWVTTMLGLLEERGYIVGITKHHPPETKTSDGEVVEKSALKMFTESAARWTKERENEFYYN